MTKQLLIYAFTAALAVSAAAANSPIDQQIAAKEMELAAARADIAPRLAKILNPPDVDVRAWLSKKLFEQAAQVFNGLSDAQRTLRIDATGEVGQLKNSNGGGLGCGWYVELNSGNAHATMLLRDMTAVWNAAGRLDVGLGYAFEAHGSLHGHVKGPAGFCNWHWSCDCPIGGGLGTTVGVHGERFGPVSAQLLVGADSANWLVYSARITDPAKVRVDAHIGLEHVGDVQVPLDFDLPGGDLARGGAPPLFASDGELGGGAVPPRKYALQVVPLAFLPDASGAAVTGRIDLQWKN